MLYYKSKYEIPLWNWLMIQAKGNDLNYLKKYPFLPGKPKFQHFMSILESLNNINSDIYANFLRWQILFTQLKSALMKDKNPVIKELESEFRIYLESLQKYHKDFEITEYRFNKNYVKLFEENYKNVFDEKLYNLVLSNLHKFKDIRFYTWDEFDMFRINYPEILVLTNLDAFRNMFIESHKVKIKNLVELDTHLLDLYSEHGIYNNYQFVRDQIFNMLNLNMNTKEKHDPFKDVAIIADILGFQINPKKTTLAEWEGYEERAKSKVDTNKPQADGRS